ncbi:DUF4388 domain-containing protein [Desulfopila aestuarii]|nr:DUF4388 domain-containing protein [Desulfopila aestuarii]
MELTDRTFSCPEGKEVCLILVRDMTQLLFELLKQPEKNAQAKAKNYSCSGCTGLIKFNLIDGEHDKAGTESKTARIEARIRSVMQEVHGQTVESPFLNSIPAEKIELVIRKFQEVQVPRDKVLVHQGEPNPNVYLALTGSFAVENNHQKIATLGAGELFGEMSYLGAGPAVASIKALEDATVLAIRADDFSKLLSSSTSVQVFMARLLADRLQQINMMRVRDFENAMSGRVADVLPAELFQVFHMHQKTGVLELDLASGKARVAFREGGIVNAKYRGEQGEKAIFAILAEKEGYYRFTSGISAAEMSAEEIGDFMGLLMEGVRRVDEDDPANAGDFSDD